MCVHHTVPSYHSHFAGFWFTCTRTSGGFLNHEVIFPLQTIAAAAQLETVAGDSSKQVAGLDGGTHVGWLDQVGGEGVVPFVALALWLLG